ncbi:hypothetical protein FOC4_g10010053 [Fusarium odoratissimum]|uniref:Gamma-glutamylcyclotransferase AIG2-like domain-containing protein n=1 Tax=Fusarium oxysporum f. sp. cubense (strain race 4) TaxID=2502994 RepID=N1RY37_FUSC4|nr:hypothetical protein FOC4_g10010053 [Fusarium odoratissimum]
MFDDTPRPPPPVPPLPPALNKKASRESPFVLKVRNAPEEWFYQPPEPPADVDLFEPPTGPYFIYGTLMDPKMLANVLGLEEKPALRPAKVSVAHAKRLAEYETNSYRAKPCFIQYTDGKEPDEDFGHVFMFVGNPRDLQEGEFDLGKWLKRVGRSSG